MDAKQAESLHCKACITKMTDCLHDHYSVQLLILKLQDQDFENSLKHGVRAEGHTEVVLRAIQKIPIS